MQEKASSMYHRFTQLKSERSLCQNVTDQRQEGLRHDSFSDDIKGGIQMTNCCHYCDSQ